MHVCPEKILWAYMNLSSSESKARQVSLQYRLDLSPFVVLTLKQEYLPDR